MVLQPKQKIILKKGGGKKVNEIRGQFQAQDRSIQNTINNNQTLSESN